MEKFEPLAVNPDTKKEKPPLLKKVERFVRGKLLSLTMAGIILLGGPLERLRADQINFFKSDKEAYSAMFKAGIERDAKKYLDNLKKNQARSLQMV